MKKGKEILSQTTRDDKVIMLIQVLFFVGFISFWEFSVRSKLVSDLAVARPWEVFYVIITRWPYFLMHLKITMVEVLLGFFCGAIVAISLAVVIVRSKFMASILYPYIIALNSTAKVAIAPLILLILGHGLSPIIFIVALISFLPLMNNLIIGLKSVDPDLLDLLKIYQANEFQIFIKARLPASLPYFFSGVKTSAVFSVKGAVIGEVFQSAEKGLGHLIIQGDVYWETEVVYAAAIITCLIGILFFLLLSFLERKILYWHESQETGIM